MTAVREYVFYCDYGGCKDWIRCTEYVSATGRHRAVPTLLEARKWARKKGWRTMKVNVLRGDQVARDFRDYCPRHKP